MYLGSKWIHVTAYGRVSTKLSRRSYCRKRRQFSTTLQFGTQIYFCLQAIKIPAVKAAVDKLTCFDLLHSPNGRPWTSNVNPMTLVQLDGDVKDVYGLGGATNTSPSDARSLALRITVTCEGQVWLRRLTASCLPRPMQRPLLLLLLMLHGLQYSNTRRLHLGQNIAPAPASIFDAPSQHLPLVFTTASVATDVNFDDTGSVSSIFQ